MYFGCNLSIVKLSVLALLNIRSNEIFMICCKTALFKKLTRLAANEDADH